MRIGLSGASGLIGTRLRRRLSDAGHAVVPLVRANAVAGESILWDPRTGRFDAEACEGLDAVVHLAGENVAKGRWTHARRAAISGSRVEGTKLLVDGLRQLARPPHCFVSASAIGIYGDRGDELLDESSEPGRGFLAEVVRDWEGASSPLEATGCRRVLLRIGLVLAAEGGALPKMALPFRFFIGGRIGSGRQWMSWISIDDLCAMFERAVTDQAMRGVYNAVVQEPVRNADFTRTLARALVRPAILPAPAFALRIALGTMADELLLASTRVVPRRLLAAGFQFGHTDLAACLRATLGR